MRILFAAGLTGLALVSLAACNKSGPASGGSSSAAAASATPAASGPLSADQLPHRRPGLWKQTISVDGGSAGLGATQLCVDANSEARMSLAAQAVPGAKCDTPKFTRNPDGSLSFTGGCDMGANGKTQTTGTIKGDFNAGYTTTMSTSYSGSPAPSMNGTHTMVVTAAWTGPCAPGEKGGDIVLPNGMKMNSLDHQAPTMPSGGN